MQVCEEARTAKAIGANLDAGIIVHTPDARLASSLQRFIIVEEASGNGASTSNGVDELKFCLIVSEATVSETAEEAAAAAYSAAEEIEGFEGVVTVGVNKATGTKCSRCWNYSTHVGDDKEHPELCERCSPVIREMGIESPLKAAAAAAAEAAAASA